MKYQQKKSLFLLSAIVLANLFIWILIIFFSKTYYFLLGFGVLAAGLGLRHAVDADHIAAIDNTTRKLVHDGKKPIAVGFFFSLGHATVVVLLSIAVIFATAYIRSHIRMYASIGSVVGILVSSFFLLLIGFINLLVFIQLLKIWNHVTKKRYVHEDHIHKHLENRGIFPRILKPFLKTVSSSISMYPIGFLFGLGFDTASEVGLLSLSAVGSSKGFPLFAILLIPAVFTGAMVLVDTLDGIVMLHAYGWATMNPLRKLYYNLTITFTSVMIAFVIGGMEIVQLFLSLSHTNVKIMSFMRAISFESVGYIIIGIFIACWITSIAFYTLKGHAELEKSVHIHNQT